MNMARCGVIRRRGEWHRLGRRHARGRTAALAKPIASMLMCVLFHHEVREVCRRARRIDAARFARLRRDFLDMEVCR
jgi:hypothetical protein